MKSYGFAAMFMSGIIVGLGVAEHNRAAHPIVIISDTTPQPKIPELTLTAAEAEKQSIYWLAKNVYFEARGEEIDGQFAVAMTTMNRMHDGRFPDDIPGVVTQGGVLRNKCQFSWYCDGKPDRISDKEAWDTAVLVAAKTILGEAPELPAENATHYHANYVTPYWAGSMAFLGEVGKHRFYLEK